MAPHRSSKRLRFTFITSNRAWGGSEELWSSTAERFAVAGHDITVFKDGIDGERPRMRRLRSLGCRMFDLLQLPLVPSRLSAFLARFAYPFVYAQQLLRLHLALRFSRRPHLVVISQGGNFDGSYLMTMCRRLELPYVVIVQKASDLYWPPDERLALLRRGYSDAIACYFVSEHNRRLTEEQLGLPLPHASVARNPFLVPYEHRSDWPSMENGIRLAFVGRMYPKEKGQDVLLRVLGREKWRGRALTVSFYGEGINRVALEGMAKHLRLESVRFCGFTDDVAEIWRDHHGLILASRCEGLPLVIVEAMLSGRVPIVTDVAGNGEVVEDEVTGFLAATPTEDALDEALERAWRRREQWRSIGAAAAGRIRELVPSDPAAVMAENLLQIATLSAPATGELGEVMLETLDAKR